MNFREQADTNEQQAVGQGDAVSQMDNTEKLSGTPETGSALFALCAVCGLGVAGVIMLGWICALAWIAWRVAGWLLF